MLPPTATSAAGCSRAQCGREFGAEAATAPAAGQAKNNTNISRGLGVLATLASRHILARSTPNDLICSNWTTGLNWRVLKPYRRSKLKHRMCAQDSLFCSLLLLSIITSPQLLSEQRAIGQPRSEAFKATNNVSSFHG